MRFAPWASAGSAARSLLGTPMRIGVLRAPCRQPWRHSAPVFVEVFSCGAPSIVEAQKGPYSSKARFWPPLRISLTSAQQRLHLLSGVFCGRSHEGDP